MTTVLELGGVRFPLRLPPVSQAEFCRRNPQVRAELTAQGEIRLMAPAEAWGDIRNSSIIALLWNWNEAQSQPGFVFGASAGFVMPDGAIVLPDAGWIDKARWDALTDADRAGFTHIVPDFVVELTSPSDSLKEARAKMEDYLRNGVRLGWLIYRRDRAVYVYRPGQAVETLDDPALLTVDPELPGFVLDMSRVF